MSRRSLAAKGVFLSYAFLTCMPLFDRQHPADIAKMMSAVGFDRCLLFSDFGQMVNPPPVEGYQMFLASLLAVGAEAGGHQEGCVGKSRSASRFRRNRSDDSAAVIHIFP